MVVKVVVVELPAANAMTAEEKLAILEVAVRRMCTASSCYPGDPLDDAYTNAGGGYGGLQAMAAKALELADIDRINSRPPFATYRQLTGGR